MTAETSRRPVVPYHSQAAPGTDGFAQLLRSEWTKFRTVRGLLAGLLIAAVLTAGVTLLNHSECGVQLSPTAAATGCPGAPTGPGGEPVTDSFYFVHSTLATDGSITVRVTSLAGRYSPSGGGVAASDPLAGYVSGVQPWAKAGIMIKASTTQGSAYAAMAVTGDNGVRMQWNYTGDAAGLPGPVSSASPRWLRLVRSGDTIAGYDSADGTRWTKVETVSLARLPASAQVGLFATSPSYLVVTSQGIGGGGASGGPTLATASFDQLATAGASGPWTGTSVGGGGPADPASSGNPFAGSYRQAGGTFTVTGAGDIGPDVPGGPDGIGISLTNDLGAATFLGLIAMVIIGAVFITGEYRRGLIRTTLTASPRRGRVLAAKVLVIAAVMFAVGLVANTGAWYLAAAMLRHGGNWIPPVPAFTQARAIIGGSLMMAVASVLALALGVIMRRGVAAVSTAIAAIAVPFLFAVVPGLLPDGAVNWLLRVFPVAAFAVQQLFPVYHQVAAQYTTGNGYYPLAWWAGLLVLCAWAAVALVVAARLLHRRDV
jgi:ABC-type transport system involved in multi-copper enzyme maturation permease subunit